MKTKIITLLICTMFLAIAFSINVLSSELIKKDGNTPPNPPVIDGPTTGQAKTTYTYYVTVTDPDEDDKLLKLEVDFGDGVIYEDCGCGTPWDNGETIEVSYRWKKQGTYQVTARVADWNNYWSEWSIPIHVTMPTERETMLSKLMELIENIIEIFPGLLQFLKSVFIK